MVGKVVQLYDIIKPDDLAVSIVNKYVSWNNLRQQKKQEWEEVRRYVFATDTTKTSTSTLPWKNKTTLPKLCQIRDNLYANYIQSLFPKRNWMEWSAWDKPSNTKKLRQNIKNYMFAIVDRSNFRDMVSRLLLDYIDYGNAFGTLEWVDERINLPNGQQKGYIGPRVVRVSPLDIVFNPLSDDFERTPKIMQFLMSLGELKAHLERISTDETREDIDIVFNYLLNLRNNARQHGADLKNKDQLYSIDGFTSFQSYLESEQVEILQLSGDIYDIDNDKFYRNHTALIADRHKLVSIKPNPSNFAQPQIFHVGWRERQDNLWAMGPLDNLVGLQYRIDHLENLKADLMDLTTFPPLKIKGYVDDFVWGPFEHIHTGEDGDVEIMSPDVNALNVNLEINLLEQKMEEMAGAPKEALGFRTPGEKTKYEVQRLENAAGRIFQSKIERFETKIIEPLLNAMFEMCVRLMPPIEIGIYNEETSITSFRTLAMNDITGNGRIRPTAAKHFGEKSDRIQNVSAFFSSPPGQDPGVLVHFSGIKTAAMFEELLELEVYDLVSPYIRLSEDAQAQRLAQVQEEETLVQGQTPSGLTPEDSSPGQQGAPPSASPGPPQEQGAING